MLPRIYTPREANPVLPQVSAIFEELDQVRDKLKALKGKLDVLEMIWGEEVQSPTNPDHREFTHYLEAIESIKKDREQVLSRFGELEVVVKSLDQGLVDFYGVIGGRLVFLCWKRGESSVEYYHSEEGFSGRRPIPEEELAR